MVIATMVLMSWHGGAMLLTFHSSAPRGGARAPPVCPTRPRPRAPLHTHKRN